MPTDLRLEQLTRWIHQTKPTANLEPASEDASFRRYFRVKEGRKTWVVMDAPPDKEALTPFIEISRKLSAASIQSPTIHQQDLGQGFLLMDDLGSTPYLSQLNEETADSLYGDALDTLVKFQQADVSRLPIYDQSLLLAELDLMPQWFLKEHLGIELAKTESDELSHVFSFLIDAALDQPQVFVHRDYHSRNLMVIPENNPGVIDFQDAVLGPICYDLVSLLRDCYIAWPSHRIEQWVEEYRAKAINAGVIRESVDLPQMMRWFDLIGLQRHIKVLGIFARLSHRDGKAAYLDDLPLTLNYVMSVARQYSEMSSLVSLFEKYDIPSRVGLVEPVA